MSAEHLTIALIYVGLKGQVYWAAPVPISTSA